MKEHWIDTQAFEFHYWIHPGEFLRIMNTCGRCAYYAALEYQKIYLN